MQPQTRLDVTPGEADAIRTAVRAADPAEMGHGYVVAAHRHIAPLVDFLVDPRVSGPIYDLPAPISLETVGEWIAASEILHQNGEALLAVATDPDGRISRYSRFTVWPELSCAEIAGAHRLDHQNRGEGKAGAANSFDWMFRRFGVRLICVTAALDNVRSARVIEAAGFEPRGIREAVRADGSRRQSRYLEMSRDAWLVSHRPEPGSEPFL